MAVETGSVAALAGQSIFLRRYKQITLMPTLPNYIPADSDFLAG